MFSFAKLVQNTMCRSRSVSIFALLICSQYACAMLPSNQSKALSDPLPRIVSEHTFDQSVTSVSFANDNQVILTNNDASYSLDLETNNLERLPMQTATVEPMIAYDHYTLKVLKNKLFVCDTKNNQTRTIDHGSNIIEALITPDKQHIVSLSDYKLHIHKKDAVITLKTTPTIFTTPDFAFTTMAVSPDSKTVAVVSTDKTVRFFDLTGKKQGPITFPVHFFSSTTSLVQSNRTTSKITRKTPGAPVATGYIQEIDDDNNKPKQQKKEVKPKKQRSWWSKFKPHKWKLTFGTVAIIAGCYAAYKWWWNK